MSFLAIYTQVFFLITYFENRKKIKYYSPNFDLKTYRTVTIVVPCFNEEETIAKTVNSLLSLNYPKHKLKIFLINDGSTDNTLNILKTFENKKNIFVFDKKNGGKHTCLNLALENTDSEFFGCLDSDSLVHTEALKRLMGYFENDEKLMAVVPSILVYEPKNMIQYAQQIEYDMAIYIKKMLGFIGGIHVTPGPFSIFRKKVFDDLGPYRKAHNTEDQEIALRMQENGYRIDHCHDAYVYTMTPGTVPKLFRQRIRWIYGFIKNAFDYKRLFFKKEYGNVSWFTLPSGFISILGAIVLFFFTIGSIFKYIYDKIIKIQSVGFDSSIGLNFDWFFLNTQIFLFSSIIIYLLIITAIIFGRNISNYKNAFSLKIIYFLLIYPFIAPFWLIKSFYNAFMSKESSWVLERES